MNQPRNDFVMKDDLPKASGFLCKNISLKGYYLQVDYTSASQVR